MKKLLGCILGLMLLFPVSVLAVPNLGVAVPGGVYTGSYELYLDFFYDTFSPGVDGGLWPDSGGDLAVWYTGDPNVDVYLATNAANGNVFSFDGGANFGSFTTAHQIDGYLEQYDDGGNPLFTYFSTNIGPVFTGTSLNTGWTEISAPGWGGGPYYYYTGQITYSGDFVGGVDWMFSLADKNYDGIYNGGEFSPKTTSATAPEPATMLLLGSGLIGLAGFGRKKFKK